MYPLRLTCHEHIYEFTYYRLHLCIRFSSHMLLSQGFQKRICLHSCIHLGLRVIVDIDKVFNQKGMNRCYNIFKIIYIETLINEKRKISINGRNKWIAIRDRKAWRESRHQRRHRRSSTSS